MSALATPSTQLVSIQNPKHSRWDKSKPFVGILAICVVDACVVYATKLHFDLLTGVALITLLFMMLQTEHERCDRVRAGWREVRRATFTLTSAVHWAQKKRDLPDGQDYADKARASMQDLYGILLLYGKGSLRDEYQKTLKAKQAQNASLAEILTVFPALDCKAEQKFKTWTLVWL
jgi:hypothetical protein